MLIYFYGEDSYRRNIKLNELVVAYKGKHKTADMFSADLEDDPGSWEKIRDFLVQPSMFTDSKVVIVRESGVLKEKERKEWLKVLKSELEISKTLLIISDREKPLKDFHFLLEPPVKYQSFEPLRAAELSQFLREVAAARGLKFESRAWNFFINYLSGRDENSWLGINELEKIALAHFRTPVTLRDISSIIYSAEIGPVFGIARDFLGSSDHKKKLALLERVLLHGEEAAYLFNSLGFQAKGRDLLRLAELDIKIKSGKLEYEEALTDFVIQ